MHAYRTLWIYGLIFLTAFATGCTLKGDPEKAWTMINGGALLVDVRTADEYAAGHLDEAIHIPVDEVKQRIAEFGEDKNRAIVVYCKRGIRSGRAADMLIEHGYTNVHNGGGYSSLVSSKQQ